MNTKISILMKGITAVFLFAALFSTNVSAQSVERIYAANSCNTLSYDTANDQGSWEYMSDQSLDAGNPGGDGEFDIICPIVRQKVGSASGAKFFVYIDEIVGGAVVTCSMTSRRPHNGALVSSGSRATSGVTVNANNEATLARSIAPSSTFGHYSLTCTSDDQNPRIHSYRIKEF